MRRLPPGPIRWPGGCFADSYDWRDGIGPHFGTNEFVRFCRLAGAEPYLAASVVLRAGMLQYSIH
jgi:alpha-L-arabinofuranosidase